MKIKFKIPDSISYIRWDRFMVLFLFIIFSICNGYGQEQDDYSEQDYGTLITRRNNPFSQTELDNTIVQCRKLIKVDEVFGTGPLDHDISQLLLKPFEELTVEDKDLIIDNAGKRRDTTLLNIVLKVALFDKDNRYIRKNSVECLANFKTDAVKKVLADLLKDNEVGLISALALVQLGQTEPAFQYIQSHYTESVDYDIIPCIVTALMKINTPDAIKLLKKISEHKDPSQALDALAALSLLGCCDFAYQGFCRYTTSNVWLVRTHVANCLLYYSGTPEAINIVKNMYYNEKDPEVVELLESVLKKFDVKY